MPRGNVIISLIGGRQRMQGAEKELQRLESLGWFGSENDFNNFHPGVTSKDFTPKDEDFIRIPFRLLSSTIVAGGSWRATNFGVGRVLRNSMEKLIGKPIYVEHDDSIGNEHGVIESVEWQEGYRDNENGIDVPAGIVGILKIDAKANPKTARSLLSDPPAIFSCSVTVDYTWEPSHVYESVYEFEDKIGEYDEDGVMHTRNATEIRDYHEVSLVPLGADPFAKMVKDGQVHLPDTTRAVLSKLGLSSEDAEKAYNPDIKIDRRAYATTGDHRVTYSFSRETSTGSMEKLLHLPNKNTGKMKDQLMLAILAVAGFETAEKFMEHFGLSQEDLKDSEKVKGILSLVKTEEFSTLKAKAEKSGEGNSEAVTRLEKEVGEKKKTIVTLKEENDAYKVDKPTNERNAKLVSAVLTLTAITAEKFAEAGELEKLETVLENYKKNAEGHKDYIVQLRKETTKFANLIAGGKASEIILNKIEECNDSEELMAMAQLYGNKAAGLFTVTLGEDGKAIIRSSREVDGEDGKKETGPASNDELVSKYGTSKMFPALGHKQPEKAKV